MSDAMSWSNCDERKVDELITDSLELIVEKSEE
jgi:hypothetical protein